MRERKNSFDTEAHLSAEEKETIITFDRTRHKAFVFTYEPRWQRHIENRLGLKPILSNEYGGKEYEVDKSRISMPRAPRQGKRTLTAEQRQAAGIRLQKARKVRSQSHAR